MPSLYAHYRLGREALSHFPTNIQRLIEENRDYYDLGLQGPDFMFFYKPWKRGNEISAFGSYLHGRSALQDLEHLMDTSEENRMERRLLRDSELAYLIGFLGHFTLDTIAHPYVYYAVDAIPMDHNKMETEFDRYLLTIDEEDPVTYPMYQHLPHSEHLKRVVGGLYQDGGEITVDKVGVAIQSYYRFKKLIRNTSSFKESFMRFLFKLAGQWESNHGVIMTRNPDLRKYEKTNEELMNRYLKALRTYPKVVNNFMQWLHGGEANPFLNRNFEMKEEEKNAKIKAN